MEIINEMKITKLKWELDLRLCKFVEIHTKCHVHTCLIYSCITAEEFSICCCCCCIRMHNHNFNQWMKTAFFISSSEKKKDFLFFWIDNIINRLFCTKHIFIEERKRKMFVCVVHLILRFLNMYSEYST